MSRSPAKALPLLTALSLGGGLPVPVRRAHPAILFFGHRTPAVVLLGLPTACVLHLGTNKTKHCVEIKIEKKKEKKKDNKSIHKAR
jgi:hypothetical protein